MDKEYQNETNRRWLEFLQDDPYGGAGAEQKKPSFSIFLSSVAMQAMIALGKMENPLTGNTDNNYQQAKFLIDTLALIKTRTVNNLDESEENLLDECLTNLKALYMEVVKNDK